MKRTLLLMGLLLSAGILTAQVTPHISAYLQNTTQTGSYYTQGNSTAIGNNILVNCQKVEYSTDWVYITTEGVPAYPTGPFLDGNMSQASAQGAIFQMPLRPERNTGNPQATTGGNIGIFINGVALFDYRDGVAWDPQTNALCGGPGNPPCPGGMGAQMDWNRDAVLAEMMGFDCSKGHPAMGNYHHHQNPSAFKLDLNVVSTVCNLYDADGLYALDSTRHSPLIGFAYDGFPIYGAYAFRDTNGTGPIARMKSAYRLRNITTRTNGPAVGNPYFLGYFREDYEYVANSDTDVLDEHNGRWCRTPEFPNGTYCYFATVDANWNSAYPYVVGPTFYGTRANRSVNSITEPTTVYTPTGTGISEAAFNSMDITVFPNPANDLIALQFNHLVRHDFNIDLLDITGRLIESKEINKGMTIAYFQTQTLYNGIYLVRVSSNEHHKTFKVVIQRD